MNTVKGFILGVIMLCGVLILDAQTPEWLWAAGGGSPEDDIVYDIAVDALGNTYVTGTFNGSATFGTDQLASSGSIDVYVAKLDPSGNWLWAVQGGGVSHDYAYDIAVDAAGNAYITGKFYGTATFGSYLLEATVPDTDLFVAAVSPSGNWLWAVQAEGDTNSEDAAAITLDGAGDLWILGTFSANVDFGSYTLTPEEAHNIFIARLDPSGNWLWAMRVANTPYYFDPNMDITMDSGGNAIITGAWSEVATFGSQTLTEPLNDAYKREVFVAKYTSVGACVWVSRGGDAWEDDYSLAIASDPGGNACVTGYFHNQATFGTHVLSGYQYCIFTAKIDSSGNWLWAKGVGGSSAYTRGNGIVADGAGNFYTTGQFKDQANFDSHHLFAWNVALDLYVAKIDPSGNWLWAVSAGGTGEDRGVGIALDTAGNAYVAGTYTADASFGLHQVIYHGSYKDLFVAKLGSGTPVHDDLVPEASALSCLYDAYPNPFRQGGTVSIKTAIAERETGTLSLFNLRGECVASHALGSGIQQSTFNSQGLPSGIYLYQLRTKNYSETKKLVLLK